MEILFWILGIAISYPCIGSLVYRFCNSSYGLDFNDSEAAGLTGVFWPVVFPVVLLVRLCSILAGNDVVPEMFRFNPFAAWQQHKLERRQRALKAEAQALAQSRKEVLALAAEVDKLGDARGAEQIRALLEN